MAAVLLFWNTNMAAVTSCENALFAETKTWKAPLFSTEILNKRLGAYSKKYGNFHRAVQNAPRLFSSKRRALLVGKKVASLILPVFFSISFQNSLLLWKRGCPVLCFWLFSEWDVVSLPSPRRLRWGDGWYFRLGQWVEVRLLWSVNLHRREHYWSHKIWPDLGSP